jgi:hypothetical protein
MTTGPKQSPQPVSYISHAMTRFLSTFTVILPFNTTKTVANFFFFFFQALNFL